MFNWFTKKPHTKAMYITAFGTVILAVSTIIFTSLGNQRAEKEFLLRMRPYLIIDEVIASNIDETTGKTTYQIYISNIGIMPGKIKKMIAYVENQPQLGEFEFDKSGVRGEIVGNNRRIVKEYKITLDDKNASVKPVIELTYSNAIEDSDENEYYTKFIFNHKFKQERVPIMGGMME